MTGPVYAPVKVHEDGDDLEDLEDLDYLEVREVDSPRLEDFDIQFPEKQPTLRGATLSAGLLAGLSYLVCSMTMVLGNKAIAYLADIKGMQMGAVFFQNAVAVALISPAGGDALKMESVKSVAKETFVLALLFVTMLVSSLTSFQYVGIATVVLMKNFSTMATIVGERLFFGKEVTSWTIVAFFVMFVASLLYAKFDIQYSAVGYFWCMVNVCSTSCYALMQQRVTRSSPVSKQGLVVHVNLFSLPILATAIGLRGETAVIFDKMRSVSPSFIAANCVVALMGGVLGYSSMWTAQTLGAGTLAMLGTLNKVPLVIIGTLLFGDKLSKESAMFCALGVVAGIIFTVGQSLDAKQPSLGQKPKRLGSMLLCGVVAMAVITAPLVGLMSFSTFSRVPMLNFSPLNASEGILGLTAPGLGQITGIGSMGDGVGAIIEQFTYPDVPKEPVRVLGDDYKWDKDITPQFYTGDREDNKTTIILNVFSSPAENVRRQLEMFMNQRGGYVSDVWLMIFNAPKHDEYMEVYKSLEPPDGVKVHFAASDFNFKFHGRFLLAYMAKTKYVLIVDDDIAFHPETVRRLMGAMRSKKALYGVRGHTKSFVQNDAFAGPAERVTNRYKEDIAVWDPRAPMTPADYLCGMWFLEQSWLSLYWRERPATFFTAEDMHLSLTARKYLGLESLEGGFNGENADGGGQQGVRLLGKEYAATGSSSAGIRYLAFKYYMSRGRYTVHGLPIDTVVYADAPRQLQALLRELALPCGSSPYCKEKLGRSLVVFSGRAGQDARGMAGLADEVCRQTACAFQVQATEGYFAAPRGADGAASGALIEHYNMRVAFGMGDTPVPTATGLSEVLPQFKGILESIAPRTLLLLHDQDPRQTRGSDPMLFLSMVRMAADLFRREVAQ